MYPRKFDVHLSSGDDEFFFGGVLIA
uniref:Uncharacterized protein n=1 Tax=Arundo donax TaxID=35708 RepID=A0A0A8ZXW6_ARUDO